MGEVPERATSAREAERASRRRVPSSAANVVGLGHLSHALSRAGEESASTYSAAAFAGSARNSSGHSRTTFDATMMLLISSDDIT